jgi:hypothetical protein
MKSFWENKFITLLNKTPKTKEEVKEMQYASEQFGKELDLEILKLLKEIQSKGIKINSIYDLVNTRESYPEIIDILIKHLPYPYHIKNKEGIIRALGVKESGLEAINALLKEYSKINDENVKFAIRLTIYNILKFNNPTKWLPKTKDSDFFARGLLQLFINNRKISIEQFDKSFIELQNIEYGNSL